jgi:c-di-GMP-binding flagellar brake protein YcgR
MDQTYTGKDRRRYKRVKISLIVVYRRDEPLDVTVREGNREVKATMLDISEGGMSIFTDMSIPVSTIVWIKFTLVKTEKDHTDFYGKLELKGEVRYNSLVDKRCHRLGVCFLNLSEKDRLSIANFVQTIENYPPK